MTTGGVDGNTQLCGDLAGVQAIGDKIGDPKLYSGELKAAGNGRSDWLEHGDPLAIGMKLMPGSL